jgi:serine/threonine-protein kinase RsbW
VPPDGTIERKFTLQVPSSTENLALIREFVGSIAQQSGMDAKDSGKLELAVDEACANVIEHAYGHDITKEVIIRASLDDETLRLMSKTPDAVSTRIGRSGRTRTK